MQEKRKHSNATMNAVTYLLALGGEVEKDGYLSYFLFSLSGPISHPGRGRERKYYFSLQKLDNTTQQHEMKIAAVTTHTQTKCACASFTK